MVERSERLVKFEVLGQEYPLHTDAPKDEVEEILDLVRDQFKAHSSTPQIIPVRVAVLVSLSIAGKYVRLKRENEQHKLLNEQRLAALLKKMDQAL